MSCEISANNAYFIGNHDEIEKNKYITTANSDYLNLDNLISSYYPLYYENVNKLYNILGSSSVNNCSIMQKDVKNSLSKYISIINNDSRIYNNNNTSFITYIVLSLWILLILIILRFICVQFPSFYTYILLSIIIIVLIISSMWSLYIFNQMNK
jgi:hypothetical protein